MSDTGALYTPELGYGWDRTLEYRERGLNPDPRLDTFVFTWETATWSYDLPNGTYLISLESGDPGYEQGPQRIMVEGVLVVEDATTSADSYMMIQNVPVEVTDGQLTVTIGGTTGVSLLNALTISSGVSQATGGWAGKSITSHSLSPVTLNIPDLDSKLIATWWCCARPAR